MMLDYLTYLLIAVLIVMFLSSAIRILREYERGIVFTLGRFTGVKGPGLFILIPFVQQMVKVDLRAMIESLGFSAFLNARTSNAIAAIHAMRTAAASNTPPSAAISSNTLCALSHTPHPEISGLR